MKSIQLSTRLVLIVFALSSCLSAGKGEFSIYLPAEEISVDEISTGDLSQLELEDVPLLSVDDIIQYSKETHEIELTASAYRRISQLEVPLNGRPFVVCIGHEPIYGGAFWTPISSMSFDGVVIMKPLPADKQTIQIQLGYPESAGFFTGEDPRSDRRIVRSLERAGKLK